MSVVGCLTTMGGEDGKGVEIGGVDGSKTLPFVSTHNTPKIQEAPLLHFKEGRFTQKAVERNIHVVLFTSLCLMK